MHIDNMEVVNRTKYGVNDLMSAEKYVKTDFDVWNETHQITKMLKTIVCAKWVRGHQDEFLINPHIHGIHEAWILYLSNFHYVLD